MSSLDADHSTAELPPVDARLVAPNERYEIYDGELAYVPPADEPHGTRHSKLSALVEAHAAADFDVAVDMLTRTSQTSDVAPDVSVFPCARDPETGGRLLEQLAFEIVSTESLSHAGRKAAKLMGRGVRRVFALDLERGRTLEWSPLLETWSVLDPDADIEDPTLAVPLPISALMSAAKADDAMAHALILKRNPQIEAVRAEERAEGKKQGQAEGRAEGQVEGRAEGRAEGLTRGRAEALLVLLAAQGVATTRADRDRILEESDPERLDRWIACATRCTDIAAVFAAGDAAPTTPKPSSSF